MPKDQIKNPRKNVSFAINNSKTYCPVCDSRLFFLEASYFCPDCGYSVFNQDIKNIDIESEYNI